MKIIIWQLKPSMHQLALVKSLKKICTVTWIMQEKDLAPERKEMGWQDGGLYPDFYLESYKEMKNFIDSLDCQSTHLFGGFNASKSLNKALKFCLDKKMGVYVQSEAYQFSGFKGKVRTIKLKTEYHLFYKNRIKGVFAMGSLGVDFFVNRMGFPRNKVHSFGYFTEATNNALPTEKKPPFTVLFVGQLIRRKGIDILLKSCANLYGEWELKIIGKGPMLKELKIRAGAFDSGKISFLGTLPNKEVQDYMAQSDLLVLPSLWDGWGAVVNEALLVGTPVITTNRCGSSILIESSGFGEVINVEEKEGLRRSLQSRIEKGKNIRSEREKIRSWAQNSITGGIGADYFLNTVSDKSIPFWLNKIQNKEKG